MGGGGEGKGFVCQSLRNQCLVISSRSSRVRRGTQPRKVDSVTVGEETSDLSEFLEGCDDCGLVVEVSTTKLSEPTPNPLP